MATKKVKVKVGVFLVVCLTLIVFSLAYISGQYRSDGVPYWLEFEDSVLGVYEGGIVQYLGVPVGKVTNISVTQLNRAHIEVVIDPEKITLRRGVEAQLVLYSLAAGTMAIELSGGESGSEELPRNSQIPTRKSAFASISTKVEELMDDVSVIVNRFEEGLDGMESGWIAEIIESLKSTLAEVETISQELGDTVAVAKNAISNLDSRIEPVSEEVLALGQNLRKTSDEAREFLAIARNKTSELDVAGLSGQIDGIMEEISGLTVQLRSSVQNLDESSASMLHEADNIEFSLRTTLQSTTDTLVTLESLLRQLKQDPSSLVRGKGKIKE